MHPFRGVSAGWLHLYLAWYRWLGAFSHNISTAAKQIVSGDYEHTRAGIGKTGSPFRSERMEPTKPPA